MRELLETHPPRARRWAVGLGGWVLLYASWQLFAWIPGRRAAIGDLLVLAVDCAAVYAVWRAGVRCGGASRLRTFWRLLAFAIAAEALGDLIQAVYDVALGGAPYPSLADPFYLAFYPLMLAALLAAFNGKHRLRYALDGATIVIGGAAIVWYLVLGPTVEHLHGVLDAGVSVAFPIGDLFLLAGLAAILLRPAPHALRVPLRLVAVAVVLGIVADVFYGYGQLHGTYSVGGFVDTLYVLEFAALALAGAWAPERADARGRADAPERTDAQARSGFAAAERRRRPRASWVPYLSVAAGLGVLLGVQLREPFFPNVSLTLIVIVLAALVGARQYVAQRELVRAQEALRRSERAKDEFLSVVGHELRTPLTSIRGSLGLLQGGVLGELPQDAANMVAMAVVNTDRLVRLVNDILDIELMAAGRLRLQPRIVDACELVEQAIVALQGGAREAGVALCHEPAGLCHEPAGEAQRNSIAVAADPDRVVQVLVNLIGNAVKFSARGGSVVVSVRRRQGRALFSVSDTGRGIPAQKLSTIFERFGQVDASDAREKGGSGLGLPIARGIVRQHGGELWAQSRKGEGSTFSFTLPLAARDAVGPPAGGAPPLSGDVPSSADPLPRPNSERVAV